jgi:activating signal cointegrator complex subunit 3
MSDFVKVKQLVDEFPTFEIHVKVQPITRTVLRMNVVIEPTFVWNQKLYGSSLQFWIWVEDPEHDRIHHAEMITFQMQQVMSHDEDQRNLALVFAIPIAEPVPPQYIVRMVSEHLVGAEAVAAVSFKHLILPQLHPRHTELLDLQPLPRQALKNPQLEALYKFSHFNPVQVRPY